MAGDLAALRVAATDAHKAGDFAKAATAYADYLARRPDDASIWSNLGVLHRTCGRHKMALRAHQRALTLQPHNVGLMNNMANVLSDLGRYEGSLALRRAILQQEPDSLTHLAMVGRCLRGMGAYDDAIAHLEGARDRHPDDAELQMQLAFAQLGAGNYADGFENYKARWRGKELKPRKMPMPEWQGEEIAGKTVLVLPEQGFGDAALFARFLPILEGLGATIKLLCEGPLLRLFDGIAGADAVVASLDAAKDADCWVNMMDLAQLHFGAVDIVPPPAELHIPDDSLARAKAMIAPHAAKLKVGVVWSGSETYKGNAFRSCHHDDMLPLTDVDGVQVYSLYKGPQVAALHADGSDAFMIDAGSSDRDFADCAAMMLQMDVVVTTDTATAHIAGSLGVDVWTVLHWDPFWVWRHEGDATEWYPSMTLYRQDTPLEWGGVINDIALALEKRVEDRA